MIGEGRKRRGGLWLALLLAVALCGLTAVAAAATAEDAVAPSALTTVGTPTESLGSHYFEAAFPTVASRPDGGLVTRFEDQLESFLADGAPDPAAPPRPLPEYSSWLTLASGKSLVLEQSKLTRLNADGSVDTGFGGTGTIEALPEAVIAAELPSGKILLAGTGTGGTHTVAYWIGTELIGADGSVDKSAGEAGQQRISIPQEGERTGGVSEIVPAADGGALVVGAGFMLELRADGTANPAFGKGGLVIGLPKLVGARVLADGSVEAVGSDFEFGKRQDLLVARYTATGAPDPGFGPDGVRRFDLGGDEEALVASWAADGSVVVGGSAQPPGGCFEVDDCEEAPILAGFDPTGNLDSGFGAGGSLQLAALAGVTDDRYSSGVEALTRRPDGSIVAAGSSPPNQSTAFLAALSARGELLSGFGEGGIVRQRRPTPATQTIAGLLPLADGGLLAAGTTDVGIESTPVLIRYAADGRLDRSFGAGAGYAAVGKERYLEGFAADDSGHLLTTVATYPRSTLLELRAADAAPEPSFGSGGSVVLPKRTFVEAVAFAAGGGALVLGTHDIAGVIEPGLVLRYRPDGTPDPRFGTNGSVDLRTGGGREVRARSFAPSSDGRILVAGASTGRLALGRLLPDGRPDPRFGAGGWAVTSVDGTLLRRHPTFNGSVPLAQAGARIYLAGVVRSGKRVSVVLLRFRADGRPDRSFGDGGRRITRISEAADPTAIVPFHDGVLVALDRGPRPLVFFESSKVRKRPVDQRREIVENLQVARAGGQLVLGWTGHSRSDYSPTYYLASRPLGK